MNENIITMNQWKEKKETKRVESQSQEYYKILSFDQLISESKYLRKKIAKREEVEYLSLQIKFIFDEIQSRMVHSEQKNSVGILSQVVNQL